MSSDYFNIDSILSEERRVPTTFSVSAAGLGHFVPGRASSSSTLPPRTRLDLPLWLSCHLRSKNMVTVSLPPAYNRRRRSRLRADAWSVNLRDACPYFYRVGRLLSKVGLYHLRLRYIVASLTFDYDARAQMKSDRDLSRLLRGVRARRQRLILDRSQNSLDEDTTLFEHNLCETELCAFRAGVASSTSFYRWKSGSSGVLRASRVASKR